jgi:prepilin peptidase CpaA
VGRALRRFGLRESGMHISNCSKPIFLPVSINNITWCKVSAILPPAILWTISLCALLWGALTDLRLRIIPDRVSLLVAVSGLTIAYFVRPADIYASLTAFALVFIAMCILGYFDFVGGGDVKLVSAVTLLVPSSEVMNLLLEIALAGGVLSCAYLVARARLRRDLAPPRDDPIATRWPRIDASESWRQEAARIIAGEPMPYAFAILGGVVLHGAWGLYQCHSAASCSY